MKKSVETSTKLNKPLERTTISSLTMMVLAIKIMVEKSGKLMRTMTSQ